MSDIVMLSATELQRHIRSRRVSCVDVMTAYYDNIERLNPAANAIVALQARSESMRMARDCDDQLARGEAVGPLHGFPHAVKDLLPVKGMRTTRGSLILKDFIAPADNLMVARLRNAGVIFIGKTNTPEFGFGSHTVNAVYGATRNAYDPARSAGGSSGGAAAALALRMVPLADGTDYGGSLRNPAGWNNVFGFRTSYGRVPAIAGSDVWIPSMATTGPMARTTGDLALLLSVQAGYDQRVPLSILGDGSEFNEGLGADFRGKRIAWLGDFHGAVPHEPEVLEVCWAAAKAFEELGCVVEPTAPNYPVDEVWRAAIKLRAWQQGALILSFYNDESKRHLLKSEAIYEVETALKLSAFDVIAASSVRTEWYNAILELFERYDFLALPTAQLFPFPIDEDWPKEIAGVQMSTYHEWMKGEILVTMTGCPALAVPAGFGVQGLPIGIQLVGPNHSEMQCLRLAFAYEQIMKSSISRVPRGVCER